MKDTAFTSEQCPVQIIDDVFGTRREFVLPESADEAIENCLAVASAKCWIDWHGSEDDSSIAVSIRKTDCMIRVHWHVVGDPDRARIAMVDFYNGTWQGGLL